MQMHTRVSTAKKAQLEGKSISLFHSFTFFSLSFSLVQDVSSISFKLCKVRCGTIINQTCLSRTSHRYSIRFRSEKFEGQVNTLNFLVCLSNHSWTVFPLKEVTVLREYCCHKRVYLCTKRVQQFVGRLFVLK